MVKNAKQDLTSAKDLTQQESADRSKMQLLYPQIIIIYEKVSFNDHFPQLFVE